MCIVRGAIYERSVRYFLTCFLSLVFFDPHMKQAKHVILKLFPLPTICNRSVYFAPQKWRGLTVEQKRIATDDLTTLNTETRPTPVNTLCEQYKERFVSQYVVCTITFVLQ